MVPKPSQFFTSFHLFTKNDVYFIMIYVKILLYKVKEVQNIHFELEKLYFKTVFFKGASESWRGIESVS